MSFLLFSLFFLVFEGIHSLLTNFYFLSVCFSPRVVNSLCARAVFFPRCFFFSFSAELYLLRNDAPFINAKKWLRWQRRRRRRRPRRRRLKKNKNQSETNLSLFCGLVLFCSAVAIFKVNWTLYKRTEHFLLLSFSSTDDFLFFFYHRFIISSRRFVDFSFSALDAASCVCVRLRMTVKLSTRQAWKSKLNAPMEIIRKNKFNFVLARSLHHLLFNETLYFIVRVDFFRFFLSLLL